VEDESLDDESLAVLDAELVEPDDADVVVLLASAGS
jgi:hypothetical protein